MTNQNTQTNTFNFNPARFNTSASNRIDALVDYLTVRSDCPSTALEDLKQAAVSSLVYIASSKGVDNNSVTLFKEALSINQEYIDSVIKKTRKNGYIDLEAAAKIILADMAKKIALQANGFTVEWKG